MSAEDKTAWLQINKNTILPEKWDAFISCLNIDCKNVREVEYPSIQDIVVAQIEFDQYGDSTDLDIIKSKRLEIKNKYPKVTDTT